MWKLFIGHNLLDLSDGHTAYYPNSATGPGYILQSRQLRRLKAYHSGVVWCLLALLAFPSEFLELWLVHLLGEPFGGGFLAFGSWLVPLLLLMLFLTWREKRFLESRERRNPTFWSGDLEKLEEMVKGKTNRDLIPVAIMAVVAVVFGNLLDGLFLALFT